MPMRPPSPCGKPGCRELVRGAFCAAHQRVVTQQRHRDTDAARPSAAKRGYNGRWQKARATFLARNPLCVMCAAAGRTTSATVVDHIIPHRGDQDLFWDTGNWQSLCKTHHDSAKQSEERGAARAESFTWGKKTQR